MSSQLISITQLIEENSGWRESNPPKLGWKPNAQPICHTRKYDFIA